MVLVVAAQAVRGEESFPVRIRVDAAESLGPLPNIWRFFGADEPNYATMPHGRKLLADLGELAPKQVYFRAHNLLCSGDGTPALKWGSTGVYSENEAGEPQYDWTILDQIFDAYLANGVRPYVQIGFMPRDLSTKPDPYQHQWNPKLRYEEIFTGWAYPPTDYEKWAELVHQWALHCIDSYGRDEVATWYWQTWNEANAGYWQGSDEEFLKLHDYAVDAVRRALPEARVGGPDTAGAGGEFTHRFIDHCASGVNYATGERGTPMDFVSFHAKGSPRFVEGRVQMGIAQQLQEIERGFRIIASHPESRDLPIVIGESDPEGCAACQGPQLGYRNGTMYSSYTAASFPRKLDLARKYQVNLEGALTWAFEFEDQPLFAGFRALSTGGINKPVLNVFRMMSRMQGERLAADSDHAVSLDDMVRRGVRGEADVAALASREPGRLCVLAWHYHDDDVPGPTAEVNLALTNLPADATEAAVTQFRVDARHGNAYTAWQEMGSPAEPTEQQYAELQQASALSPFGPLRTMRVEGGQLELPLSLPRQAVSLVVVEWGAE
ncbi:MAG: beta-xylosidase [Planctomycetaceae bacterium]|nr:beta-xylosidase [Planctomycetaceae bacterium]